MEVLTFHLLRVRLTFPTPPLSTFKISKTVLDFATLSALVSGAAAPYKPPEISFLLRRAVVCRREY